MAAGPITAWRKAAALAMRARAALIAFARRWDQDALERARDEARTAERRLRAAIDVMPEGLVFLDSEGRYILWNKRYAEIYHRSADLFAPGRKLVDTLKVGVARGDYPEAIGREEAWLAERVERMRNPGPPHEQQLADGRWIMIEERATGDGGIIGLRVDITEMKARQEALRQALARAEAANRAKSEFLANMSHEIRTPLNGVLGLAGVLDQGRLEPDQREIVSTLLDSAGTLEALLRDLLTFARLEAGQMEIAREPFRLREAIETAAAAFRPRMREKGLELRLELTGEADAVVLGDPARLQQILTNLISNAVKFTERGSITIRHAAVGRGETRRQVLEVSDTGIGFDPEDAERLFRRFEQADGSMSRKYGGTGLGLAICRQLADLMGGAISATARPGKGATFRVELPLPPAQAAAEPDRAADAAPAVDSAEPLRILVAEDNPTNRKVAELMLAAIGAEVDCVENGQEAVEAVRRSSYDVALMDLQMPVMDGLTAILTAIPRYPAPRRAPSAHPRLPIIVVSANVLPEHLAASAAAGADGHIGKPVRPQELISAVRAAGQPGEDGEQFAAIG
ncbi:MAG: ATP-binding protein [Caulobacteraceae bacterium]